MPTELKVQRASLCVFPDGVEQDGTCKKYSCQHYSKSNCASMQQMLLPMDPTATLDGDTRWDYFECETLTCQPCPEDTTVRTPLTFAEQ